MVTGVVVHVDNQKKYGLLQLPGTRQTVLAAFSEIKNVTPAILDEGEVVNFTLIQRGKELLAHDIRILVGR